MKLKVGNLKQLHLIHKYLISKIKKNNYKFYCYYLSNNLIQEAQQNSAKMAFILQEKE